MAKNHNLIINGSGSYPGGNYEKVVVRGEGTIVSDIDCSVFKIFGTSEALFNVKVGSMKVMGEAEVKGNLDADELHVMGTMSVDGKAPIKHLKMRGMLDVGESLTGESADIKGSISAVGNVEFEAFTLHGSFEIKGLLSADIIRMALRHGCSTAEEIGGGKIIVKRKSFLPFLKDEGSLFAKVIEGDDIYLENTEAEIVRGKKVEIGPGCTIGLVEYSADYIQDKDSVVKTKTKQV
jgi:cytoskeletal protein CcmA (bactofilin family)